MGKIDFDTVIRKTEAKMKEDKQSSEETVEKLRTLKKIEKTDKLTEEDVKKAMGVTCFASLAYCCGLEKDCFWRNSALQALKIPPSKFKELKARFTEELNSFVLAK